MATIKTGAILNGEKELKKMLGNLGLKGDRELRREVRRTSIGIENHYKRNVKSNYITGQLESSIKSDTSNNWLNAEIGSTVKQAIFIEFGTKAHVIEPKSPGEVLVFSVGGETVFSKKVQHPGTKANPGLLMAWLDWMVGNKFADRLRKRFDRIK